MYIHIDMYTLPETNSLHLKIDGWQINFHFGKPGLVSGALAVSFRECNLLMILMFCADFALCRNQLSSCG